MNNDITMDNIREELNSRNVYPKVPPVPSVKPKVPEAEGISKGMIALAIGGIVALVALTQ